ncbi:MAG: hypothetical protein KDA80_20230 [Planctomycetaceae bacterium]|nr:hypothetical protein [Planctomycetaceae bacterium]
MQSLRGTFLGGMWVVAIGMLAVGVLAVAQEESGGMGEVLGEKERRGPLPTYYGQIGVTDDQREKLYAVQDEYEVQLEALRQQLKKVVRERDQKMEELLTPGQQLRLKELREAAKARAERKEGKGVE